MVIVMLRVRSSFRILMGLLVLSAGYIPGTFGQLFNVASVIAVDIDTMPPAQSNFVLDNASHVLSTDHYTQPIECPIAGR